MATRCLKKHSKLFSLQELERLCCQNFIFFFSSTARILIWVNITHINKEPTLRSNGKCLKQMTRISYDINLGQTGRIKFHVDGTLMSNTPNLSRIVSKRRRFDSPEVRS